MEFQCRSQLGFGVGNNISMIQRWLSGLGRDSRVFLVCRRSCTHEASLEHKDTAANSLVHIPKLSKKFIPEARLGVREVHAKMLLQ